MAMAVRFWIVLVLGSATSSTLAQDWRPSLGLGVTYHGKALQQQQQPLSQERFGLTAPSAFGDIGSALAADDQCPLHKVVFNQELYYQYVQYNIKVPDLKEFTLCAWTNFHNHSTDHPIFSYNVADEPRAILAWVSNTEEASYYSMAVGGNTFYRLNYPLRMNRWYHSCQSWNGRTGEWQIWVDGERVGRGFHNRLVGHVIKGGGTVISGQEQTQQVEPRTGTPGMMGEITMVQLYNVALTAGKAHKDHKHHHVHHFDHNGQPLTTPVPATAAPFLAPAPPPPGQLVGGQITEGLELNLANGQPQPQIIPARLNNGLVINTQLVNGQFRPGGTISEQLYNQLNLGRSNQQRVVFPQNQVPATATQFASNALQLQPQQTINPLDIQFLGGSQQFSNIRFTRGTGATNENVRKTRDLVQLPDGAIVDDSVINSESLLNGLTGFGSTSPANKIPKESDEREPAEAEVRAVMDLCNGCEEEPFLKALVIGWRSTSKKVFSGAFYFPAASTCKAF